MEMPTKLQAIARGTMKVVRAMRHKIKAKYTQEEHEHALGVAALGRANDIEREKQKYLTQINEQMNNNAALQNQIEENLVVIADLKKELIKVQAAFNKANQYEWLSFDLEDTRKELATERKARRTEIEGLEKTHNNNLLELDKEVERLMEENAQLQEEMEKVKADAATRIANVKEAAARQLAKLSDGLLTKDDYLTPFNPVITYEDGRRVKTYSLRVPVPPGNEENEEEAVLQINEHINEKKEVSLNILELVSITSNDSGWVAVIRETYR